MVFRQYATELHIELHLICRVACCTLPCHASLKWTCIILDCASCHVYACVFTVLFASFPVVLLLDSSGYVAIVSIHSTTLVRLLHGLVLLPCGISGKMTIPLKSLLSLPPILLNQASNPPCPSKPLIVYVTALLSPSYSVASCR